MTTYKKLEIEGVEYTDAFYISPELNTSENNTAGNCEILFPNENGLHNNDFKIGDEVVLYLDKDVNPAVSKIFVGIIRVINKQSFDTVKQELSLICRDYLSILQDTLVEPEVYNNQEVSIIVQDLIAKYGPSFLTGSSVQSTGLTMPRITFLGENLFDVLLDLAKNVNFIVYIDVNKVLHFEPIGTVDSGVTLDETNVALSTFKETADQEFVNKVWVYGDMTLTGVHEEFVATGGSEYTLQYNPKNVVLERNGTVYLGGADTFVGDMPSGLQYTVNYYDKQIRFISGTDIGDSIPYNGSFITDYQREKQIIKYSESPTSIAEYWASSHRIVDTNIKDPGQASLVGKKYILNNSIPKKNFTIDIYSVGALQPGQNITVNLPKKGIVNEVYSIVSVSHNINAETLKSDLTTTVSLNKYIFKLTDTIKDLQRQIAILQAANIQTDIISRLSIDTGQVVLTEKNWELYNNQIGQSFVIGHERNGVIGYVNTGSEFFMSGAQFCSGTDKKIGASAMWCPGSAGNGLTVVNSSGIGWRITSGVTVALWCKPYIDQPAGVGGSAPALLSRTTDTTNPSLRVDINGFLGSQGCIRFMTGDIGSNQAVVVQTLSGLVFSGVWSHIACTWQSGSKGHVYHNGIWVGSCAVVTALINPGSNIPVNIGWNRDSAKRGFVGAIDDVRIYNKMKTEPEIGSISKGFTDFNGLVVWYDFEEMIGSITYPYSITGSLQPLIGDHITRILEHSGGTW